MNAPAPLPAFPAVESRILAAALALPEAAEDFPWGERVLKVRGKIFLFMGQLEGGLRLSMKLPFSREFALEMPEASPTRYGLGKAGWVTFRYPGDGTPPDADHLIHWLRESYRAVAPKRLAAQLSAPA